MGERLRGLLLRVLRVPPEPAVPAGGRVIRVFRAAPNYFRYRLWLWAIAQVSALAGLIGGLFLLSALLRTVTDPTAVFMLHAAEAAAWAAYVVQLPFSLALLRLDFDLRWYILMDRSLRVREGVISVREKTMTFANIQQISIRRNPLQRLLGLADVQVQTAGGGGSGSSGGHSGQVGEGMHEAFFRGVDNAEEIRTAIQERVRLHRDSGLGDPDDAASPADHDVEPAGRRAFGGAAVTTPVDDPAGVLASARALREEAQQWRESIASLRRRIR